MHQREGSLREDGSSSRRRRADARGWLRCSLTAQQSEAGFRFRIEKPAQIIALMPRVGLDEESTVLGFRVGQSNLGKYVVQHSDGFIGVREVFDDLAVIA